MASGKIVELLQKIAEREDHPIEKLEDINELLELTDDSLADTIFSLVTPILRQMRSDYVKNGDFKAVSYIASMCEVYNLRLYDYGKPTPYEDNQSVHVFMEDTLDAVNWLIVKYPPTRYVRPFNHQFIDFIEKIYDPVVNKYTLVNIFTSIIRFISSSPYSTELMSSLKTEMDFAKNSCVSGHLAAMVSAIRGFPGVPDFIGNGYQHQKAAVFNELNKRLTFEDLDNLPKAVASIVNSSEIDKRDIVKILKEYTETNWRVDSNGTVYVD